MASLGAERRSRAAASQENHWHGAGVGCEDVIGGRLRSGCQAGVVTAIVRLGPAPVYSMLVRSRRAMPGFSALLHSVAKRPAMYVGRCSVRAVSDFLNGYCQALSDLGQTETPLDGWMRWIELRFLISHPAWHWSRILLHVYESDQAAIEALPGLHREFLAQRAVIGVGGIEAALDQRLTEEHGEPWYEPPATSTTIDV